MSLAESADALQKIADYRKARKILRASGTGAILFGILALVVAVPLLGQHIINFLLVVIGIFLIAEGMFNIVLPTAEGIIVDGIGLAIVGLWNIVIVTGLDLLAGAPQPRIHWAFIGLVQICWGIYRFTSYRRFYEDLQEKPMAVDLERMDALVKSIKSAKLGKADDIIEFQHKGFFKQQRWKGQLGGEAATFVDQMGHDVLVAHKDDVNIEVEGKVFLGNTLKATFQIRDRKMKGLISPESYQRYQDWKELEVEEA